MHFTPTSGSWLNLVEVWFGIIEKQAIHRGTFASVRDLTAKIRLFINAETTDATHSCGPKTADQILKKANRPKNSPTDHQAVLQAWRYVAVQVDLGERDVGQRQGAEAPTVSSRLAQIRETSGLSMPESTVIASTRSSTLRVENP